MSKPITPGREPLPIRNPNDDKKQEHVQLAKNIKNIPINDLINTKIQNKPDINFSAEKIESNKIVSSIKETQNKGLSALKISDKSQISAHERSILDSSSNDDVDLDSSIDLTDELIQDVDNSSQDSNLSIISDGAVQEKQDIDLDSSIDLSDEFIDTTSTSGTSTPVVENTNSNYVTDAHERLTPSLVEDLTTLSESEVINRIKLLLNITSAESKTKDLQFIKHTERNAGIIGNVVVVTRSDLDHFMNHIYDKHEDFKKENIANILVVHDDHWESIKSHIDDFVNKYNSKTVKTEHRPIEEENPSEVPEKSILHTPKSNTMDVPNLQKNNKRGREARKDEEEEELAREIEHDRIRNELKKEAIAREKNSKIERSEDINFEIRQKRIKTAKDREE